GMLYLAWCSTLIGGFINFQIGLGMALMFATVDQTLQPRRWWVVFLWRVVAALLLTVMHIFSLGFYLAIVFGLEFSPTFVAVTSPGRFAGLCVRLALAASACLLPALCLFIVAPVLPGQDTGLGLSWNNSITLVFANLLSAVWTYSLMVDVLLMIPIVLVCSNAIRTKRLQRHAGLLITALGLLLIACISPRNAMGTGWISWRFPIMAALVAMVMICPLPRLQRKKALMLALALTSIVFARTAWIGFNWWQGQSDVADVRAALTAAPEGAAILPLANKPSDADIGISHRYYAWREDTFRHLATLAVPFAHDFVPTVFTAKGKQPLAVLPPWSDISVPEGNLFTPAVLSCPAALESYGSFTPYLRQWRQRFDFVLILNADMPDRYLGAAAPSDLKLVRDSGFAKLYAIDKTATSSAPAKCPSPLVADK
ncbi:MAG: hypothetical protein KGI75_30340, partial [Rhizobiaceae bacterium]|nr:hypothetical protein [Rhizobiaceae bacterium]